MGKVFYNLSSHLNTFHRDTITRGTTHVVHLELIQTSVFLTFFLHDKVLEKENVFTATLGNYNPHFIFLPL